MTPEQITAWALSELSPEERAEFESSLGTTPELRSQAEELASFCTLLTQHLGSEEVGLTPEQRQQLTTASTESADLAKAKPLTLTANTRATWRTSAPAIPVWKRGPVWGSAAAAALVLGFSYQLSQHTADIQRDSVALLGDQEADVNVKLGNRRPETETLARLDDALRPSNPPSSPLAVAASQSATLLPELMESKPTGFGQAGAGGGFGDTRRSEVLKSQPGAVRVQQGSAFITASGGMVLNSNALPPSGPSGPMFPTHGDAPQVNGFLTAKADPLSTFSADVDTAAYTMMRRSLNAGQAPSPELVRVEELINYFPYDYAAPSQGQPFSVNVEVTEAPWAPQHRLARIGIRTRPDSTPVGATNYVFLVDVSGSMSGPDRLQLVQHSLTMLTEKLHEADRVALVTYAGSTRVVLPSTAVESRQQLQDAISQLTSGGGTAGSSGIHLAYEQAKKGFVKGGINRVILCTDGDFNVGITDRSQLESFITEQAKSGVFLSVLGFGVGNTQDATMELLADKGNGNYSYIDSLSEARKVLVDQRQGTLVTVAKDVKFQVEFNPFVVQSYRLIGYENRMLAAQDFNNDQKDAGEVGADHSVTALYEIVPVGVVQATDTPLVDDLKYQQPKRKGADLKMDAKAPEKVFMPSDELLTVKIRYKAPESGSSEKLEVPVTDTKKTLSTASADTAWATSVAAFGMKLRGQLPESSFSWESVRQLALKGKGADPLGYRGEFLSLIDKARSTAQ